MWDTSLSPNETMREESRQGVEGDSRAADIV